MLNLSNLEKKRIYLRSCYMFEYPFEIDKEEFSIMLVRNALKLIMTEFVTSIAYIRIYRKNNFMSGYFLLKYFFRNNHSILKNMDNMQGTVIQTTAQKRYTINDLATISFKLFN